MTVKTETRPVHKDAAKFEEYVARAIAEEDACQQENIELFHRLTAAGDEPGFCGDLRRAIHNHQTPLATVSAATGIEVSALSQFLQGTAELTSSQIAAIVQFLNLQLMRTIPKTPPAPRKKNSI